MYVRVSEWVRVRFNSWGLKEFNLLESQSLEDSTNGSLPVDNKLIRVWAMFPSVVAAAAAAGCRFCGWCWCWWWWSCCAAATVATILLFIVIFSVHPLSLYTHSHSLAPQRQKLYLFIFGRSFVLFAIVLLLMRCVYTFFARFSACVRERDRQRVCLIERVTNLVVKLSRFEVS